jgi:hypothetical protein
MKRKIERSRGNGSSTTTRPRGASSFGRSWCGCFHPDLQGGAHHRRRAAGGTRAGDRGVGGKPAVLERGSERDAPTTVCGGTPQPRGAGTGGRGAVFEECFLDFLNIRNSQFPDSMVSPESDEKIPDEDELHLTSGFIRLRTALAGDFRIMGPTNRVVIGVLD